MDLTGADLKIDALEHMHARETLVDVFSAQQHLVAHCATAFPLSAFLPELWSRLRK